MNPGLRRRWHESPRFRDVTAAALVFVFELLFQTRSSLLTTADWFVVVPMMLVVPVTMWWRRRAPMVLFAVATVVTVVASLAFNGGYQPFWPMLVGLFTVGAETRLRVSVECMALSVAPLLVLVRNRAALERGTVSEAITFGAFYAMLYVAAWFAGWLTSAHRREVASLEKARQQAIEIERRRLARELHDVVSHAVSVMVLQAAGAKAMFADHPALVETALDSIESSGRAAMNELRRMLDVLRRVDQTDDDHHEHRGLHELGTLIDSMRSVGLAVDVQVEGDRCDLDASIDHTAFRVVQEALTNALRHGGTGQQAQVHIDWARGLVIDVTSDDAEPSAAPASDLSAGYGLLGLHERVTMVGGSFEAGAGHDHRFRVRAELPIDHLIPGDPP